MDQACVLGSALLQIRPLCNTLLLQLFVAALIANKAKEITRLNSVYNNLLKNAGVDYIEGKGSLVDTHTVKVGRQLVHHWTLVMCRPSAVAGKASNCSSQTLWQAGWIRGGGWGG